MYLPGDKQLMTMCRCQRRSASRIDCIDNQGMRTMDSRSHTQDTTNFNPTPTEPFGEVVCQYTDTLYTTQKQTNLTNSLLQNIAVFNEHDSIKLEEWLTDIETSEDLTSES